MKLVDFRRILIFSVAIAASACVSEESITKFKEVAKPVPVKVQPKAVKEGWRLLAEDGIHDPSGSGIKLLQEPGEALATLPPNKARISAGTFRATGSNVNQDGNKVDWVESLANSTLSPRRARFPYGTGVEREELVMDMDMFLDLYGSMPIVRFPHLAHTRWLACSNCHPAVFVPQSGANPIQMEKILTGEQCGICHRAVAFPPTDCTRCHSIDHASPEAKIVKAQAREKAKVKDKSTGKLP